MMKRIAKGLLFVLCMGLLVGCSQQKVDDARKEEVKKKGIIVVEWLHEGLYDDINALCTQEMKEAKVGEQIATIWPDYSQEAGKFKEFSSFDYYQEKDQTTVIIVTKYEKKALQYTITFNEQNQLSGFYIK